MGQWQSESLAQELGLKPAEANAEYIGVSRKVPPYAVLEEE